MVVEPAPLELKRPDFRHGKPALGPCSANNPQFRECFGAQAGKHVLRLKYRSGNPPQAHIRAPASSNHLAHTSRVMVFPVRVFTKICILAAVPPEVEGKKGRVTPGDTKRATGKSLARGTTQKHTLTVDGGSERKSAAQAQRLPGTPLEAPPLRRPHQMPDCGHSGCLSTYQTSS